ncbi:MAG: hypothetical protein O6924_09815 [Alphaproteobacteria bacterium]|nr:hypothetical protein [Alphaproteobacteria bacterium]
MLKDWFLRKVGTRALESSTKEVRTFVDGLKAMSDEDIGTVIAVATVIRINFESHGVIPEDVFEDGPLPTVETLGGYQLAINRVVRQFRKMGLVTDAMGAMVWSYTLRCLNVPELRELGLQMWAELRRGFPHVEKALKKAEEEKGGPFHQRVWAEWKSVPAGFGNP